MSFRPRNVRPTIISKDAVDLDLIARRTRARDLCQTLNATREADSGRAEGFFATSLPRAGSPCRVIRDIAE
jgi:hypothetical protein